MPKGNSVSSSRRRQAPAMSIEEREQQLIYEAIEMASEQLETRTASAQVVTHFLKLGSSVARLEAEKLARENELLKAKTDAVTSQKNTEELYRRALMAMRSYSGEEPDDGEVEE